MKLWISIVIVAIVCGVCYSAPAAGSDDKGMRFYLGIEYGKNGVTRRFGRYPLEVGNVWTYHNVYKSCIGAPGEIITITWTSDVTVCEHVRIPEGTMVLREGTVRDVRCDYPAGTKDQTLTWYKTNVPKPDCYHYLVFKSGYALEVRPEYWDDQKRVLTEDGIKALNNRDDTNGEKVPDLPDLVRGELPKLPEGDESSYWRWCVEDKEDVETPIGVMKGAVHLLWMANGGGRNRYFKDGIGYVKEWYKHGGSIDDDEHVLVSFKRSKH